MERLKRRWWVLMAGPFFGAFVAHPCFEHILLLLCGAGISALGMRKPHCCVDDCITKEEIKEEATKDFQLFEDDANAGK